MALGSTQPLREMSIRNISWGEGTYWRLVTSTNNLTSFVCRFLEILGSSFL